MKPVLRRMEQGLIASVALLTVAYAADLAAFYARGKPTDSVTINRYLAVPLKGNKTKFDSEGSASQTCSQTLFPQSGLSPCWYLRKHATQVQKL